MRFIATLATATACFVAVAAHAAAGFPLDLRGKVVYVDDGDTLVVLDEQQQQHKVRLTDLDAPETAKARFRKLGQPFGAASGRNLARLAKGKPAVAHCYEYDRNERLVCRVIVDNVDLSLAQIHSGYAWANGANRRYVRDERAYQYEQQARRTRVGLWADPNPIAPWVWRRSCWEGHQCPGGREAEE